MSETLTKVDSAVQGLGTSPPKEHVKGHRRASSSAAGVFNINDLGKSIRVLASRVMTQTAEIPNKP